MTYVRTSRDLRQDFSRPTSGVIRKGFVPVARLCFSHFNGEQPRSLEKGRPPDLLEVRNNHVRSHRIPVCSTRISSFSGKFFFSTCFRSFPFCQDTAMCLNKLITTNKRPNFLPKIQSAVPVSSENDCPRRIIFHFSLLLAD